MCQFEQESFTGEGGVSGQPWPIGVPPYNQSGAERAIGTCLPRLSSSRPSLRALTIVGTKERVSSSPDSGTSISEAVLPIPCDELFSNLRKLRTLVLISP